MIGAKKNRKLSPSLMLVVLFVLSSLASFFAVSPSIGIVHAASPALQAQSNNVITSPTSSLYTTITPVGGSGELRVVMLGWITTSTTLCAETVLSVVETDGQTFNHVAGANLCSGTSSAGDWIGLDVWWTTTNSQAAQTITATFTSQTNGGAITVADFSNPTTSSIRLKSSVCATFPASCPNPSITNSSAYNGNTAIVIGAGDAITGYKQTGGSPWGSSPGFSIFGNQFCGESSLSGNYQRCFEYYLPGSSGSTQIPMALTAGQEYVSLQDSVIFDAPLTPPPPMTFTGKVRGLDCGNCLIVGRPYVFIGNATDNEVSGGSGKLITQLAFQIAPGGLSPNPQSSFSFAITNSSQGFGTKTGINPSLFLLGSPTVHAKKILGVWEWNASITVILRSPIQDATNVHLLLAVYVNSSANGFHSQIVQTGLQIISQGGATFQKLSAANASAIAGAGTFACKVGYKGSCATNSTWFGLQQYSTQFAVNMQDIKNCPETNGQPSCTQFWQNQPNAVCSGGTCAEVYSNPGDWKITIHWYSWDNITGAWVDVQHVVISLSVGNEGDADQWTTIMTSWYVGNSFVKNQTLTLWIEQGQAAQNKGTVVGQVRFFVDMWLSRNNGSTIHGGRVGAYWTGMHNDAFLFWSSWSPTFENQTEAIVYAPNPNGRSAQSYECSKIGWVITRQPVGTYPTIGMGSRNPKNYTISVSSFAVEKFLFTSNIQRDGGVGTPNFVAAQVPNLPNSGILAPLFALFASVGALIWGAIAGALGAIWAAIGSQFPWFIAFWADVYSGIVAFFGILSNLFPLLLGALGFLGGLFSFVLIPVALIQNIWTGISPFFSWLPVGQIPLVIELILILFFSVRYLTALNEGNFGLIFDDARKVWRIADTITFWAYRFAKAILDAIMGLIP